MKKISSYVAVISLVLCLVLGLQVQKKNDMLVTMEAEYARALEKIEFLEISLDNVKSQLVKKNQNMAEEKRQKELEGKIEAIKQRLNVVSEELYTGFSSVSDEDIQTIECLRTLKRALDEYNRKFITPPNSFDVLADELSGIEELAISKFFILSNEMISLEEKMRGIQSEVAKIQKNSSDADKQILELFNKVEAVEEAQKQVKED